MVDEQEPEPVHVLADARARAETRLAELTATYEALVAASVDSNADDEHDPEGATIALERAQLGATVRRARTHLAEVVAAQGRVEAGSYGTCASCGGPVGRGRLEARPTARRCVACAAG